MSKGTISTLDGNEAVAHAAYRLNEVIAIYPITPSSNMGEWSDQWASENRPNIWGTVPSVCEMQSEGGAAGAVHGALQTGALTTTFTCSQGLLLMIPNMYKIAGELTPCVIHVAARAVAASALSIFGDHQDIMSTRASGFGILSSSNVQEAHDFVAITQAATLESRIPFIHAFDGFRTSHEVSKVELLDDSVLRDMIDYKLVAEYRSRSMSPDHPSLRGTAQNPDVYFQGREGVNPFYQKCPQIVQNAMDKFGKLTGRSYKLYEYYGHPQADRVIVLMGSGCDTVHETVDALQAKGEKIGVMKVRLFRPFDMATFIASFPSSVKSISVLDRTKEPGCTGEPLYLDTIAAINEFWKGTTPKVLCGRYGLSSKEFTPAMVKGVYDNMAQSQPRNHFTLGIIDDVSNTHIPYDATFSTESSDVVRCLFYGLGSDGTVGANKNSIKIIGEETSNYAQGYFVYDSKKSGSTTVSHLRFGPKPIRSAYLVTRANFIGVHMWNFLEQIDLLSNLVDGGTVLLNAPYSAKEIWQHLPGSVQRQLIDRKAKLYTINATQVAEDTGMGGRVNTIMQTCFFALSGVLPRDEAIKQIKKAVEKTYGKKGQDIVAKNIRAIDETIVNLHEVTIPASSTSTKGLRAPVTENATPFVRDVLGTIIAAQGDSLPVSKLPVDGVFPTGTSQYEKRTIALRIPEWDSSICIQCGKCSSVCPHAVIRMKAYQADLLKSAPAAFKSVDIKDKTLEGMKFSIQVSPQDCTGCGLCVQACPVKNKANPQRRAINMTPIVPVLEQEMANWKFFETIPYTDRKKLKPETLRSQQLQQPLFEFSGACGGCGETPYVKMLSQLFGDHMVVANATGCSSIYGANLPTTPWSKNCNGCGPAWANSLFEDNAEFGLGFRLSLEKQTAFAIELLKKVSAQVGGNLVENILSNPQKDDASIEAQRGYVAELKKKLETLPAGDAQIAQLKTVAEHLVRRSVWIIGGDGWAYDIGYGGLDHVIASGKNVNILVLDTEVYSNTGGQASKATPRGAVAKFAMGGKPGAKKDLGLIAMSYGNVYVATVALGSSDAQTLKAFVEAEAYDGPSIIIAYSHCIAHGMSDMDQGLAQQKSAVDCGRWILYRYNPELAAQGKNPLQIDSQAPKTTVESFMKAENRFSQLARSNPEAAQYLLETAQKDADERWKFFQHLASRPV